MRPRTALVVGAGIGGLAAGLALQRSGWHVTIYERAVTPRELGFALALAPNALAALEALGIVEAMIAEGVAVSAVEIRRPDGRVLRRLNAQLGGRFVVALRPALHGALLAAIGEDALVLDSEAVGFSQTLSGVVLGLRDGRTAAGDVLIGADGVGSVIRRDLHRDEPSAQPSGFVAVRGVARHAGEHLGDLAAVGYFGDGVESALARASSDTIYWYVSLLASDVERGTSDPRAILERHTRHFDATFRAVTGATGPDDMRFDELLSREPLDAWGRDSVTLLGDAAHPMLPHAGQGAAQALEDAVALGLALAPREDIPTALRHYERVRSARTRRIVQLARRIAGVTTTRNGLVRALRDAAIRVVPEAMLVRSATGAGRDPRRDLRTRRPN